MNEVLSVNSPGKRRFRWQQVAGSRLLQASAIYTASSFANSAIPFLMLPIFTRYLTPTDYGIVAMYQVLLGIVSSLTHLNVHGAIVRRYYDRDKIDFPRYISNCVFLVAGCSMLSGVILWGMATPIARFTEFPAPWIWAVILASAGEFLVLLILSLWQVQEQPIKYGLFQVGQTLTNICLSLLFVVSLGLGWKGRVWGQVCTMAIFASLSLFLLFRGQWLKGNFRLDYLHHALAFGVPLIPHAVCMYVITVTGRLLLTHLIGVAETGIYMVGVQIGMIVWLLQDSFNRAWVPWFYAQLKRDDESARRRIVRITYLYILLITVFALGFALLASQLLGILVGRDFLPAGRYLPWICMGYAFNGMYKMVTNYCFFVENTRIISLITVCTALINAAACYLFITWHGPVGAAQGTMLAFGISFLLTWMAAARVYPMPWGLSLRNKVVPLLP